MKASHMLRPHDARDLGWFRTRGTATEHYYRHRMESRVVVAHCMIVQYRADLVKGSGRIRCQYCQTIEDARNVLEGKEYVKDSENHYGP